MAHFVEKVAHLFKKVAQLWLILGSNLAHFRNFHLETLNRSVCVGFFKFSDRQGR